MTTVRLYEVLIVVWVSVSILLMLAVIGGKPPQ